MLGDASNVTTNTVALRKHTHFVEKINAANLI